MFRFSKNNKFNSDNSGSSGDNKNNHQQREKRKRDRKRPLTTAVLKVALNSRGCINKINKLVWGFEGVTEMSMDMERQLVTVKGTMDSEALTEYLKDTLKRPVEIVPPTKDDEDKESDDSGDDSNRYNARNYRSSRHR
ncbi:hypothetical protein ACOSP7_003866 [Xanthoceras sorbifolium]